MVYTPPTSQLRQWPTPNYIDPEERGPELVVVNSVFLAFATIFIALRLYTRIFVKKWFGLDDILIALGYVRWHLNIWVYILMMVGGYHCFQRHYGGRNKQSLLE